MLFFRLGVSEPEGQGGGSTCPFSILTDQLTLAQPSEAVYAPPHFSFRHHVIFSHIYKEEKKSRENEVVHALSKEQKGRLPAYLVLCGPSIKNVGNF